MASMHDIRTDRPSSPSPTSKRSDESRSPEAAPAKSRAQRFTEAHAWVLEHHAATFEKLAK